MDWKVSLGVSLRNEENRSTGGISLDGRRPNLKAGQGRSMLAESGDSCK